MGLAGDLAHLDPTTLAVKATMRLFECSYFPVFVTGPDALYAVDDCYGVLYRVDPVTGAPIEGWPVPLEESSDTQLSIVPTSTGIWFVDDEQTGQPYSFNPERGRFERMDIDRQTAETIYAFTFDSPTDRPGILGPRPARRLELQRCPYGIADGQSEECADRPVQFAHVLLHLQDLGLVVSRPRSIISGQTYG